MPELGLRRTRRSEPRPPSSILETGSRIQAFEASSLRAGAGDRIIFRSGRHGGSTSTGALGSSNVTMGSGKGRRNPRPRVSNMARTDTGKGLVHEKDDVSSAVE